jgi:hypothetical protein
MEFLKRSFWIALFIIFVFMGRVDSYAGDDWIKDGFAEAVRTYSRRSADNPQIVDDTLNQLSKIEGQSEDSDLNYDILIFEARVLYWKGDHVYSRSDKLAAYSAGQAKAEEANLIDDGYAEAYYYSAINFGRWAEADGAVTALGKKNQIIALMKNAIRHPTRENKPGESIDGFGPHRFFGRLNYKLPSWAGGSLSESIESLQKAYIGAKNFAVNVVYYAESLNAGTQEQRSLAKRILTELVSHSPTNYNGDRVPETMEEFELARQLIKVMK